MTTIEIINEMNRLYRSINPADVEHGLELRRRWLRRIRRHEARHDSGPGRRNASAVTWL